MKVPEYQVARITQNHIGFDISRVTIPRDCIHDCALQPDSCVEPGEITQVSAASPSVFTYGTEIVTESFRIGRERAHIKFARPEKRRGRRRWRRNGFFVANLGFTGKDCRCLKL